MWPTNPQSHWIETMTLLERQHDIIQWWSCACSTPPTSNLCFELLVYPVGRQLYCPPILCSSSFNRFLVFFVDLDVRCPIAACSCACTVFRHVSNCAVDLPPCLERLSAVTLGMRASWLWMSWLSTHDRQ